MTDNVLPSVVEKRVRYFDGQFLQDQDFTDEQDYQLDRERRHNRLLHGPGITEGLAVTSANANQVTVSAGSAIDSDGRQLVLAQATSVDLPAADFNDKQGIQLLISYQESAEDPQTVGGSQDFTRWLERPALTALPPGGTYSGDYPAVLLMTLALDSSGRVTGDNSSRVYSGLLLPSLGADAATLSADSTGAAQLAGTLKVTGSVGIGLDPGVAGLQLAQGKALRIEAGTSTSDAGTYFSFGGSGVFSIDAPNRTGGRLTIQNSGNVGLGTATPAARLDVAGGGGQSVDLQVNGRLRSNSNDGGLWVSADRFIGGDGGANVGFYTGGGWRLLVAPGGNVGVGTASPAARLEVVGGGGQNVDLQVNGRLRSNSNDGGLYVSTDRFIGGDGGKNVGFATNNAWRLLVTPAGNIGIGTASPAYALHLAADSALRLDGASKSDSNVPVLSLGGYGAFNVDAPNRAGGRFTVQNGGNVGVGTTSPGAKLEIYGSGDQNVDLLVNGRLRSNSSDGGLWVSTDRFIGGDGGSNVGFWNGSAWRLLVTQAGYVGIGTATPANALHLAIDNVLRIEGAAKNPNTAVLSLGGTGAFAIDAPGLVGGRLMVQNGGNVGIGTNAPGNKLTVSSDDGHLQLRREASAAAGTKIYLELYQDSAANASSYPAVYPCLRFHHSNVFWHRIEGRPDGMYFKDGNPAYDSMVDVYANNAVLSGLKIGNTTIGERELIILQKLANGSLQFDLLNTAQNEYAYAGSYAYDSSRRYVFTWQPKGQTVSQGRWQIENPS